MLRPLPFPHADRLVVLAHVGVDLDRTSMGMPPAGFHTPTIDDLSKFPAVFAGAATYASGGLNLADPVRPQRVQVGVVTASFFPTIGIQPIVGRAFSREEGRPGGRRVVVLSHALWQGHFGGRPMLDSTVVLSGRTYTVVGVMPRGFNFPGESDLWIPLTDPMTGETFAPFRGYIPAVTVARLAGRATVSAAQSRIHDLWNQALTTVPASDSELRAGLRGEEADGVQAGFAHPFQTLLVSDGRRALLVLLGATILLLLIACANVTNLLLSQAAVRRREVAVRAVLGATRGRIVRQMVTESIILAMGGTAVGVLGAPLLLRLVTSMMPKSLAGVAAPGIDARVLAFAAVLALATGVGFGVWPALGATRGDYGGVMKGGGDRGATAATGWGRRTLIGAELALATVLLVGAGLMLHSLQQLVTVNTGLQPEHTATLELAFGSDVRAPAARLGRIQAMVSRLEKAPGIQAAGIVNRLPLAHEGGIGLWVGRGGQTPGPTNPGVVASAMQASGGYFRAMGIQLVEGRTFTSADDSGAPPVAIIDRALADTTWPGQDPIGRKFTWAMEGRELTVVGVVTPIRTADVSEPPGFLVYQPVGQSPPTSFYLVARGTLTPAAMLARVRDAVRAVDPSQAVYRVRMMDDVISSSIAPQRTNTFLISLFGALALVLTALGVYAVVAYSVAQRRRELGIRAALGATGRDLVGLVSREMVWVTAGGLLVGLAGAWAASRVMASLVYGVTTHDPATFVIAPLALLVPAAIATLLPARRAARTNPVDVIREE